MRVFYLLFILIAIGFLSACTTATPNKRDNASANNPQQVKTLPEIIVIEKEVSPEGKAGFDFSPYAHAKTAELMRYINDFSQSTAEWQKAEFNRITAEVELDPENWRLQIKQAAILAIPNSEVHNPRKAKQLLTQLVANNAINTSDQNLVKILAVFNNHQQQQTVNAAEAAKKQQVLIKKNKALEQKLNDIKNIEKTMIERNAKSFDQ